MASKALAERQAYQPSVLLDPVAWAVAMIYGMVKPYVMTTGYEFLYIFVSQDIRWLRTRREGDTIIVDSLPHLGESTEQLPQPIPATNRTVGIYSNGNHQFDAEIENNRAIGITVTGRFESKPEELRYGKP